MFLIKVSFYVNGGEGKKKIEKNYSTYQRSVRAMSKKKIRHSLDPAGGFNSPVMARRTSLAASSRASTEACSLYQDV